MIDIDEAKDIFGATIIILISIYLILLISLSLYNFGTVKECQLIDSERTPTIIKQYKIFGIPVKEWKIFILKASPEPFDSKEKAEEFVKNGFQFLGCKEND
jgi:hypothetical protein